MHTWGDSRICYNIPMQPHINYYTYIRSAEWYARRATLIKKQCAFTDRIKSWPCDNKRLELHHIHYRNLGNETEQDVLTVCDRCHSDITWNGHYRRPMWEQEAYVMELLGKNPKLSEPSHYCVLFPDSFVIAYCSR